MSVYAPISRPRAHSLVLARHPIPIVVSSGSIVPIAMLSLVFVVYSSSARTPLLLGAAALGGVGGALSLIIHELGHVGAAWRLKGVKPVRVSLLWLGAGTKFEGAYRSGRDQAKVAVAGPAASFAFACLLMLTALMPMPRPLQYGLFGLALLNAAIAVVSLLPVYPLDGHKLLVGLVWRLSGTERHARSIVRRAGMVWLGVEALGCVVLLFERPAIGGMAIACGAAVLGQKRLGSLSALRRRSQH